MTLMGLLIHLRASKVRLEPNGDRLRVDAPEGALTPELRQAIREHKPELLALPRPHIGPDGTLIDPCDALPQYFWQPLAETLKELNAPPEVWARYTSVPYPGGAGQQLAHGS